MPRIEIALSGKADVHHHVHLDFDVGVLTGLFAQLERKIMDRLDTVEAELTDLKARLEIIDGRGDQVLDVVKELRAGATVEQAAKLDRIDNLIAAMKATTARVEGDQDAALETPVDPPVDPPVEEPPAE